jgi:hypothetical protein
VVEDEDANESSAGFMPLLVDGRSVHIHSTHTAGVPVRSVHIHALALAAPACTHTAHLQAASDGIKMK